ncbi:MAG: (Fe-S)-binding protein [Candidatus Hodarchaeales archaeon]|jgi:heterodisulfide reductase subunit D
MVKNDKKVLVPVENVTRLQRVFIDTCTRCGSCGPVCPTYYESKDPKLIPAEKLTYLKGLVHAQKSIVRKFLGSKAIDSQELGKRAENLYHCTLCGRCTKVCPLSIDIKSLWPSFRQIVEETDFNPSSVKDVEKKIKDAKDPYGLGEDLREFWIDSLELDDVPINEKANLVYFVGCTSAFKKQHEQVPRAVSLFLNHIGENWTLLGEEEICCGAPALMTGDKATARELAESIEEKIEEIGATTVVTSCAGCYRTLKWEYPHLLDRTPKFKVAHVVGMINQCIKQGKLELERTDQRISYHDPCELGRLGGMIEEPRVILKAMTRNFVELPENKLESRCCGGGGLLQIFDSEMAINISSRRIRQANELNIDILVSACPACEMTLREGVKKTGSSIEVIDIVELVAKQLGLISE